MQCGASFLQASHQQASLLKHAYMHADAYAGEHQRAACHLDDRMSTPFSIRCTQSIDVNQRFCLKAAETSQLPSNSSSLAAGCSGCSRHRTRIQHVLMVQTDMIHTHRTLKCCAVAAAAAEA